MMCLVFCEASILLAQNCRAIINRDPSNQFKREEVDQTLSDTAVESGKLFVVSDFAEGKF